MARESKAKALSGASLDDVLVLSLRKSFWASAEAERFPHRLYATKVRGHGNNAINTAILGLRLLGRLVTQRPRLLVFGSAHRLAAIALMLRKLRLLRTPVIVTNRVFFGGRLAPHAARVIVHWRGEGEGQPNHVFIPLPADGDFDRVVPELSERPYVFSGGGEARDYVSLIEAMSGVDAGLQIVTFNEQTLGAKGPLPANCEVSWTMPLPEFLGRMAGALFVVVPLRGGQYSHGHTTVAQALSLGKAVVTTRDASVGDYVQDGAEGILVEAGDVSGYRSAITRLLEDEAFREACEARARERREELSYASFAATVERLCLDVLREAG